MCHNLNAISLNKVPFDEPVDGDPGHRSMENFPELPQNGRNSHISDVISSTDFTLGTNVQHRRI